MRHRLLAAVDKLAKCKLIAGNHLDGFVPKTVDSLSLKTYRETRILRVSFFVGQVCRKPSFSGGIGTASEPGSKPQSIEFSNNPRFAVECWGTAARIPPSYPDDRTQSVSIFSSLVGMHSRTTGFCCIQGNPFYGISIQTTKRLPSIQATTAPPSIRVNGSPPIDGRRFGGNR